MYFVGRSASGQYAFDVVESNNVSNNKIKKNLKPMQIERVKLFYVTKC